MLLLVPLVFMASQRLPDRVSLPDETTALSDSLRRATRPLALGDAQSFLLFAGAAHFLLSAQSSSVHTVSQPVCLRLLWQRHEVEHEGGNGLFFSLFFD